MECADKTVFTFARAMVQIKQVVLIKWCGVYSNQKNHQGLLWNVHCVLTVLLRLKEVNFKSVVKICDLSCFFSFVGDQTKTSAQPSAGWDI